MEVGIIILVLVVVGLAMLCIWRLQSYWRKLLEDKFELNATCARLDVENEHLKTAYMKLNELLDGLKLDIHQEFKQLKNQAILELQTKAGETLNQVGQASVVVPLAEKLRDLDNSIIQLRKETHAVGEKSANLSEQANNLSRALVRDSQKKGEFGEMILANILEFAGLKERVHFIEQVHIPSLDGTSKNLRADCVLSLPDGRGIVIDSKNIIGEYYQAVTKGEERSKAIKNSVLTTIKSLAAKDYVLEVKRVDAVSRELFEYVIMFIPNEGLFNLIVELDAKNDERGLIWQAYQQKVIIAGPSTILAVLAIIDKLWQNHQVEEKAQEVLKIATQMVDQLRITLERMTTLGSTINRLAQNYNEMVISFAGDNNRSMTDKLVQLTSYKQELANNQPVLADPIIERTPSASCLLKQAEEKNSEI